MIVEAGFPEMLDRIKPLFDHWRERIIPDDVELLTHNRYSPRYAWMFSYEKRLKYRIEELLGQPFGPLERQLFGADGAFSEGLSNAFVHGHNRDAGRPIEITCAVGAGGLAFSICDGGPGFDHRKQVERVRRGDARYLIAGNGLRTLVASESVLASWEEGGRRLNLLVPFRP